MKRLLLLLIPITTNAGPFAEVSLSVREQHTPPPIQFYYDKAQDHVYYLDYSYYDKKVRNPYMSLRVGYSVEFMRNYSASLSLGHESSISTGKDRGINDLKLSLRWGK